MCREFAIADTCFLIDWARYRRRDSLFKLFRAVFVPEAVLREVKSEGTIAWISTALAGGSLALYTESQQEREEAVRLVEESRRIPHAIPVDVPEAVCLVVGRKRNYVVLTENRGALISVDLLDEYKDVVVWRALEVLTEAQLRRVVEVNCNDVELVFREYEEDAEHVFPRRDLEEAVELIRRSLCRGRGGEAEEVDRAGGGGQED